MLFFAIVYLVEGIGQARVGIIYQPLTHYLKDDGWTALQVTAYFAVLNFPWVIKPVFGLVSDFVPLFGYRRKSYLIIASVCAVAAYAVIARHAEPGAFALPLLLTSYAMATASTLCGALLAENGQSFRLSSSFVSQQWLWFYIAIMASSFAGGALVEALPAALRPAGGGRHRRRRAHRRGAGIAVPARREEGGRERAARCGAPSRASWRRRRRAKLYLVALFLFLYAFAPGFGTPLYYFMTDELQILAELHRHSGRDRLGRLDRRRPGASLPSAQHELEGAAHSQHRARHAVGRLVPAAGRPGHARRS